MKLFTRALAVGLMALYLVFIADRMARSEGAQQNLMVLLFALGIGVVIAALVMAIPRGRKR